MKNIWRGAAIALICSYSAGFLIFFFPLFKNEDYYRFFHHFGSSPRCCSLVLPSQAEPQQHPQHLFLLTATLFPFCPLLAFFSPPPLNSLNHVSEMLLSSPAQLLFSLLHGREGSVDVPTAHGRRSPLTWSDGLRGIALGACVLYRSLISCHYQEEPSCNKNLGSNPTNTYA